jgi:hypothetical protein
VNGNKHAGTFPTIHRTTCGFEPTTTGLQNRCPENTSPENLKTCESAKPSLTPQWTPDSPKPDEIDTSRLPSDLAEIVAVWPDLPEHIKAAIKALVQTHIREGA